MKLFVKCFACKESFKLDKSFISKPDLVASLGEYFKLKCPNCMKILEFHANDVDAQDSLSGNLIGSAIGIVILLFTTLFIWNEGFITNLGLILGAGIIGASNYSTFTSNTNAFNNYKIRREPKRDER